MNEGNTDRRGTARRDDTFKSSNPFAGRRAQRAACPVRAACRGQLARRARGGVLAALCLWSALQAATVHARDASMLDERVTQASVADTICKPGYADTVSPPMDALLERKNQLLAARGIDPEDGPGYALDRRVPVVLGGSPDAPGNLDLLPWGGHRGERRKELLTAKLKRCVCTGKMSLSEAQAAIAGDWPAQYARLRRRTCDDDSAGLTTDGDDGS
jgi:hypothetical protein